ncbi:MAG: sugar-binding domain-containing protein, partial [Verrucomicrobiota bacterium]
MISIFQRNLLAALMLTSPAWLPATIEDAVAAKPLPRFSTAGFFAVPNSPRTVLNFNPGWRFLMADAAGAEKPDFDDSSWEAAALPHSLEILGENASGCRNYQGPAWYRKRFEVAGPSAGGRVFVYFEAVMGKCVVCVNGQKVAEHFGGCLPFAADITDKIQSGGNIIAVRADNSDDPTYPPGKPQNNLDFTYLGGIYRDTYLIQTGPVHVTLPVGELADDGKTGTEVTFAPKTVSWVAFFVTKVKPSTRNVG